MQLTEFEISFPKRTEFERVETIRRQGREYVALSAVRTADGSLVVEYVTPEELDKRKASV